MCNMHTVRSCLENRGPCKKSLLLLKIELFLTSKLCTYAELNYLK